MPDEVRPVAFGSRGDSAPCAEVARSDVRPRDDGPGGISHDTSDGSVRGGLRKQIRTKHEQGHQHNGESGKGPDDRAFDLILPHELSS